MSRRNIYSQSLAGLYKIIPAAHAVTFGPRSNSVMVFEIIKHIFSSLTY